MNELLTFFSKLLQGWMQSLASAHLNRVLCFLLALVALGGILCAMFGKKSILNRGLGCTLGLMVLYLTAAMVFAFFPKLSTYLQLPFLTVTEGSMTLVSPLSMEYRPLMSALARFLLLVCSACLADTLIVNGQNPLIWLCTQLLSIAAALVVYLVLVGGIELLAESLLNELAILLPAGLGTLILIFLGLSIFATRKKTNPAPSVHAALTSSRGGLLVSVCATSFLLFLALLACLPGAGFSVWTIQSVRSLGFFAMTLMCLAALCIFSTLFYDRKKP